ncbi:MAG: chaperone modulator CbpM [Lautropia sp.]
MNDTTRFVMVDRPDGFDLTLAELTASLGAERATIVELTEVGILEPVGASVDEWRFAAQDLRRCRIALRLVADLGVNAAGAALALDLLARIDELERRIDPER